MFLRMREQKLCADRCARHYQMVAQQLTRSENHPSSELNRQLIIENADLRLRLVIQRSRSRRIPPRYRRWRQLAARELTSITAEPSTFGAHKLPTRLRRILLNGADVTLFDVQNFSDR